MSQRIGVVGDAGMTAGVAQVAALAGHRVLLYSTTPQGAAGHLDFARRMLRRQQEKGQITAEACEQAVGRLASVPELAGLGACDLVVESMLAGEAETQAWLSRLEDVLPPQCVIGLNTSSHPVTTLARGARHPGRVLGLHFFDPVPLMRVVELIAGLNTDEASLAAARAFVASIGHTPVQVADHPGFMVNTIGRALLTEGMRILQENIATPQDVDRIARNSLGLRMGPFELLDLIGLGVSTAATQAIYAACLQEPRLRPTPAMALRVDGGLLGRASGRGFYEAGAAAAPPPAAPLQPLPDLPVWVEPQPAELHAAIRDHLAPLLLTLDEGARPAPGSLCLVAPLGLDVSAHAVARGLDPERTVGVDACFALSRHATLMAAPAIAPAMARAAHGLFSRLGPVSWIQDSPGFVAQRLLAAIVNLASEVAQQAIAAPDDIDLAVRVALGYPQGPLAWGDHFGAGRLLDILTAMQAVYGDPRYRPSPWLRRRAQLRLSLLHRAPPPPHASTGEPHER